MDRSIFSINSGILLLIILFTLTGCGSKPANRPLGKNLANLAGVDFMRDGVRVGSMDVEYHGMNVSRITVHAREGGILLLSTPEYDTQLHRVTINTDVSVFLGRPWYADSQLHAMLFADPSGHLDTLRFEYDGKGLLNLRSGDIYAGMDPAFEYHWSGTALDSVLAVGWDSLGVEGQVLRINSDHAGKPIASFIEGLRGCSFVYRFDRDAPVNIATWIQIQAMIPLPAEWLLLRLLYE
jgi:hypothetical protein